MVPRPEAVGSPSDRREGAVRVLAFAGARDAIGEAEVAIPLPAEATAGAVLEAVLTRFPALRPWASCLRVAVNGEYVDALHPVSTGDEVALIPPVAGG